MTPEQLTAIAAVSAAVLSLLNVLLTAHLSRSQDSTKWTRDLLPPLVIDLTNASHETYMALFDSDWDGMNAETRENHAMPQFKQVIELIEKLEVFARPRTIQSARMVEYSLGNMRAHFLFHHDNSDGKWQSYWKYAEASYRFLVAARREMGLRKPPVPPGLKRRRDLHKGADRWRLLRANQRH